MAGGDRGVTLPGQPLCVRRRFTFAFGMLETGDDRSAVHDQSGVGRVHHVRQAGDGVDHLDGVAQFAIGVAQGLPLCDRVIDVDPVLTSIQGLIAYSTPKNVGRVITYRRGRGLRVLAFPGQDQAKLSWGEGIPLSERNQSPYVACNVYQYCTESVISTIHCARSR